MKVRVKVILLLCALCIVHSASCSEVEAERQAQFYYNFYAARKALDEGHYTQAYSLLKLCEAILPTDGKTQEYLGIIYDAVGNHDKAKGYFLRAYECAPNDLYKYHLTALMSEGKIEQALQVIKTAAKANSEDPDAWNSLMQIAQEAGDYKSASDAIDQIERILGYSRYSALARYNIAVKQSKYRQAIQILDTYLKEDPTDVPILIQKALVLENTHASCKKLIPVYETILQLDGENALILNNYAYYLATHKGDLNQAEQMSFKAIQIQPEIASYLDTYGWILHLKGQDNLAKFYLQKALNLEKEGPAKQEIIQHLEKIK